MKRTIRHMRKSCPVAETERGYRKAVDDEDYAAAAVFRDRGAGLVGWWCGRGETEDEPGGQYGVMLRITPEHGRYVGVSFSARDLAALQERNRRRRRAGSIGGKAGKGAEDETRTEDADDEPTGVGVFELWLEKDAETGELRRRAVRVDHFPVGALDSEDGEDEATSDGLSSSVPGSAGTGFATALGGFPLSGPIAGPGELEQTPVSDADEANAAENAFAGWRVSDGAVRVSASSGLAAPPNPFPFDVDGVSMAELLSYERQGFMAEFNNTPGFKETWARLKAEHAANGKETNGVAAEGTTIRDETRTSKDEAAARASGEMAKDLQSADPDVFEAFGGKRSRNASTSSGERREPHDEYFFEKYVINETDGDAGIVDLDDLDELFDDDDDGGAFDIEDLLSDDDDDIVVDLDAAAMALLDGRRLDQLPKGLPAAMVADIQRAIEARGMGRAVFPDDGGDDDDASASEDAEDDPWATEEVRIPVDMAMDGHHAFRVWSDDDEEEEREEAVPGSDPLERVAREAAAPKAEIEAAVLRGVADAKARLAQELENAADATAREKRSLPLKGETETVAVNFDVLKKDAGKTPPRGSEPGTDSDGTADGDGASAEEKRAAFDAPDAPSSLGGDASAMRFVSGSAASVFGGGAEKKDETAAKKKSAGERFFERLVSSSRDDEADDEAAETANGLDASSEASETETAEASDAKDSKAAPPGETSRDVSPPRGFISPASLSSSSDFSLPSPSDDDAVNAASRRLEEEAASALMEALGGDTDALPLPGRTRFTRVPPSVANRSSPDPFDRLYLGAFGPHGPEVLRLVRGRWGDELGVDHTCVTAVKLTGDANVPAGAASFRARVGVGDALDSSFSYPEELGVVTRFKGQGRVAKPGFAERNWVDGELLLLDGRGGQLTGGAELGFVWAVPGERRLLILFSSLELPDASVPSSMYLD